MSMEDKEYYKFTFKELTTREITHFYKRDFLVKYPTTKCVLAGNLIKTCQQEVNNLPV